MASASPKTSPALDALIIGAGFAGLYQLHLLRDKLGLSVKVLEAADGVGGTWYWNRYPGARCDSESHSYCFTFSEDLVRGWDWSERYPQQPEILRYLNYVTDTLKLKRDIQFETRVVRSTFDERANLWTVETENGERHIARYLITAVGCLSTANVPNIPGRETFKGRSYHTGQWPHDGVDFSGQRVGIIGTGSTGIQAIPVIAQSAKHLTVFQRTANYSVPARNVPLTDTRKREIKETIPQTRANMMKSPNGHSFLIEDRATFDVSADEREALYEAAWQRGGLQFRAHFKDILTNLEANNTASTFIKRKIREIVKDPATAEVLADIDHPYSAKRPPIDTGYFETFNRQNVSLVDLRNDPIAAITEAGVRTRSGEHALDILVFATGFDAMTGPLFKLNITGRDGLSLQKAWEAGPQTYLGLQVAGFPNLFTITGPGSPSVLTNMPVAIEQHAEWIAECIASLRREGRTTIEATPEAVEAWAGEVRAAVDKTLFNQVKHSWYLGANIPGKPRVFMPYIGGMPRYREICADVAAKGYDGFVRR
jgi:cation diffusion facilitator CzcD-associated flavoprotein CzcO